MIIEKYITVIFIVSMWVCVNDKLNKGDNSYVRSFLVVQKRALTFLNKMIVCVRVCASLCACVNDFTGPIDCVLSLKFGVSTK